MCTRGDHKNRWLLMKIEHYNDVIMGAMASQITSLTIVYSTDYSGVDQRKHQSFASLAFVGGIHRGPVNSPHEGPVTRKMISFDDVIMRICMATSSCLTIITSMYIHIDGSVHDCSNSSTLAMELLESCAKPSILSTVILLPPFCLMHQSRILCSHVITVTRMSTIF